MQKIKYLLFALMIMSLSVVAAEKPNIVYILADDMGVGDVSIFNPQAKVSTPHIDAIAAKGMKFTDAHSSSSVCTPTRYSLLTGRYSWRTALKKGVSSGYSKALIAPDRDTVADLLKRNGYQTAMIGKSHLGMNWQLKDGSVVSTLEFTGNNTTAVENKIDFTKEFTGGPRDFGFDYFYGIAASLDFPPYAILENRAIKNIPTQTVKSQGWGKQRKTLRQMVRREGVKAEDFTRAGLLQDLTEKTVSYIDQVKTAQPFFIYMPLPAPHTPVLPRKEFIGTSKAGIYGDFIHEVDWSVGQVIAALEKRGLSKNTLVIFAADNGASPGAFPLDLEKKYQHKTSYIYKGRKASLHEGGHRVPFMIKWPDKVPAGTTNNTPISLNSLYATLADIFNAKIADNAAEDSTSILPLLTNEPSRYSKEKLVHHSFAGDFAIRSGDWKLTLNSKAKSFALFNLKNDIAESNNIYNKHPEVAERLLAELTDIILSGRSTPGVKQLNDGEQHWPQLFWLDK